MFNDYVRDSLERGERARVVRIGGRDALEVIDRRGRMIGLYAIAHPLAIAYRNA